jgi:hypothetical protein
MAPNDKTIGLTTALIAAVVTAFALEYMIHAEWGMHRAAIREDALGAVGLLVMLLGLKAIFTRDRKGS